MILGVAMALMLILRPSGITGGREFGIPGWRRAEKPAPPAVTEGTTP